MKCSKCETENEKKAQSCVECGFELKTSSTQSIQKAIKILIILMVTFFLLLFTCAIIITAYNPHERASVVKCKSNLRQLATALELYVDMRGRGSRYPPFNGSEMWAALYRTEVMIDSFIYLCPSTDDFNQDGKLLLGTYGSGNPPPTACSYGGRLNKNPKTQIKIFKGSSIDTPIGCDDDEAEVNHYNYVNVVFLDTSVRSYSFSSSNPSSSAPELGGKRIGAGILSVCGN